VETWLLASVFILAAYGFLSLAAALRRYLASRGPGARAGVSVVVLMRNQAHVAEGFLRSLVRMASWRRGPVEVDEIVAVDDASSDDTRLLVERLSRIQPLVKTTSISRSTAPDGGAVLSAADVGLFLCKNRVLVVVNLDEGADALRCLSTIGLLLGEPGARSYDNVTRGSPRGTRPVPSRG